MRKGKARTADVKGSSPEFSPLLSIEGALANLYGKLSWYIYIPKRATRNSREINKILFGLFLNDFLPFLRNDFALKILIVNTE